MRTMKGWTAVLGACLIGACGGPQAARPNLPPPEYEEPAGALVGVTTLGADAPADAGLQHDASPQGAPGTTP